MLLSDISRKEIIDGNQAEKLGMPGRMELDIDENSGRIREIIISSSPLRRRAGEWRFHWEDILKIGEDVLIMDAGKGRTKRSKE
ncbi:YlmC/YmxH family sporulation protein [Salibacterium halotolerans]|uniref:Sporulation protein, YlmC/YmxH family n=1 Tax=Salibacterium halotolerans TaxID=1884432 RepID=A0A1I5MHS5_9BACI|nr:YlmC/YmxH family sporulation protein [Salibacterium halotolerans]SFP09135.1 sporulation protein, YlmC/YmxH family [Salibacterium halotolerans]